MILVCDIIADCVPSGIYEKTVEEISTPVINEYNSISTGAIIVSRPMAISAFAATRATIARNKTILIVAGEASDCTQVLAMVFLPSKNCFMGSAQVETITMPIYDARRAAMIFSLCIIKPYKTVMARNIPKNKSHVGTVGAT